MPLTTTGDQLTSDRAARIARLVPGRPPWQVTWLPGQFPACGSAVIVFTLPAAAVSGPRPGHRTWPRAGAPAADLGQAAPQVITLAAWPAQTSSGRKPASSPPRRQACP